jgi:hypothetical protein
MSAAASAGGNKITNVANGTALTDVAAYGQIGSFQHVQAMTTGGTTTSSTSFVDTQLTASITPSSASHRVKIAFSVGVGATASGQSGVLGISRAGSDLFTTVNTPWRFYTFNATGQSQFTESGEYIDSPASTTSVTYTIRVAATVGTSTILVGGALNTGMNILMTLEEIL